MSSRLFVLMFLEVLIISPVVVFGEDGNFQVGNENVGAQGGAQIDPEAGFQETTFGGGERPKCANIIDRNMRDCEEEELSKKQMIISAVVFGALFLFGLVLGVLDYCW